MVETNINRLFKNLEDDLFKVELRIDSEHFKTLAFAKPTKIKNIVTSEDIKQHLVAYKIDCKYINSQEMIDKDVKLFPPIPQKVN